MRGREATGTAWLALSPGESLPPPELKTLKKDDKLLFAWNPVPKEGPSALRWTPAREKAVKFVLAPGWERKDWLRCPRCRGRAIESVSGNPCEVCAKRCTHWLS